MKHNVIFSIKKKINLKLWDKNEIVYYIKIKKEKKDKGKLVIPSNPFKSWD